MNVKNENFNKYLNETDKLIESKIYFTNYGYISLNYLKEIAFRFIKTKKGLTKNKYYCIKILNIILILFLYNCLYLSYKHILKSNKKNEIFYIDSNSKEKINYINNYYLPNYINGINNNTNILFGISFLNYSFSLKHNIIEVDYNIYFSDENNNIMTISDLIYDNDLHIVCHMKKLDNNISIDSLSNIYLNKYYKCIEYFNIKENVNLGIKIYKTIEGINNSTIYFFTNTFFDCNNIKFQNDSKFEPLILQKEYYGFNKELYDYNNKINENSKLKKSYNEIPLHDTKSNIAMETDKWNFANIYNNYFCFCKGFNCSYQNIDQLCKYKFYLYIIDSNRYLYNKTDYLLADFLGTFQSSDDAYPIFKELIKQKKRAYYMTRKKDIYKYHCNNNVKCKLIISTIYINGNFIEKYLELFLRLKVVIAGSEFYSMDDIFYNIEYVTFICLTHGINYFKPFLYNNYYSYTKYDKLVISTSNKIIKLTKKYGWIDENIIKICFPKWDKYDNFKSKLLSNNETYNRSIFFFFTWRNWRNITNKINITSISSQYFKNIFEIMNNDILRKEMKRFNITIYFSLHHMFERYRKNLNVNPDIKFVHQINISDCLSKSDLIITDFSSIIFDAIYQRKPYIMYIPDYNDPNITDFYDNDYCDIINNLKNGSIYFENKIFKINDIINKIKYYISNNFKIEKKLEKFYDSFEFKCGNNTKKFINYLESIK